MHGIFEKLPNLKLIGTHLGGGMAARLFLLD